MAIIYSYPEKTTPAGGDFLVITDSEQPAPNKNRTKSLTIDNLANYVVTSTSGITGSGTVNTIAMFTPTGVKIGDSIITQTSSGAGVTINGGLNVVEDLNVTGSIETSSNLEVTGDARFLSTITAGGTRGTAGQVLSSTGIGVEWTSDTDTTYDLTGQVSNVTDFAIGLLGSDGTLDKVSLIAGSNITLTDNGSNGVTIASSSSGGTVTGTGTTQNLPIWSDGPNGVLSDSTIKQHDGNNITIGANVGTATGANYTLSVGSSNNVSNGAARALAVGANNVTTGTPVDLAVIGIDNSANSSYSLTVGQNNQTNSGTSFVAGIDNITSSNTPRQFVIGRENNVDSVDTIVLGDSNTVTETGAGFGSMMVFGHLNKVLGDRILCLGTSNTINSNNQGAYIIGAGSSSTGDRTYSVGQQNAITGNESYAFGKSNTIAAAASVAVGTNNSISAIEKAYAFGFGNDNINFKSFAIGDNNDVLNTQRTYLIGRENKPATDNTIILGQFSDPTVLRTNNTNGRSTVAFAVGVNNGTRRTAWEFRGRQTSTGGTSAGDSMRVMAWALLYSTSYADDTAAAAGGVEVGQLYRTGSTVKIRMT
jgi:hypothetical protein